MLEKLLKEKNCFKLVCGAGNEDARQIERLTWVYAQAGCRFFDVSANQESIDAVKNAFQRIIGLSDQDKHYICLSVGLKNDPHIRKLKIDSSLCNRCGFCKEACTEKAIFFQDDKYTLDEKKCVGCGRCYQVCDAQACHFVPKYKDVQEILSSIDLSSVDCIELHAIGSTKEEIIKKWSHLETLYKGMLSLCIDRSNLGNNDIIDLIKTITTNRKPFSTIIQADGTPISGIKDTYKSTLQAVAAAEIVYDLNLPIYLILSGGTNSKSLELANICEIYPDCIAIGSYARKIVSDYINRNDFFANPKAYNAAINAAKELVEKTKTYSEEAKCK